MLDPVLDLIEREGLCPSDHEIISSYKHLAEPSWVNFFPLVNFTANVTPTRVGTVFEFGPFTQFEKTALWGEDFLAQGDMITGKKFEGTTFRLIGRIMRGQNLSDLVQELPRIVTAITAAEKRPGRSSSALFQE